MGRWIQPNKLVAVGISIQEQIEWAEGGLKVYDDAGRRIIEYGHSRADLPKGCIFLANTPYLNYGGDGISLGRWSQTHRFFHNFQFKTSELTGFIKNARRSNLLNTIYCPTATNDSTDPTVLSEIYSQDLAHLLSLDIEFQQKDTLFSKQIGMPINDQNRDTSKATAAREIKTAKSWCQDLEIAVALAVECTKIAKPKSTAQHRAMWEKMCAAKGIEGSRKEAFAAFRRGLPPDLKMNKC